MNNRLLIFALAASIVFTGVFGFAAIAAEGAHTGDAPCPFTGIVGGECPPVKGDLGLAVHHVSAIRFTDRATRILPDSAEMVALLAALILIYSRAWKRNSDLDSGIHAALFQNPRDDNIGFPQESRIRRWFVCTYHADPSLFIFGV